MPARQKKKKKKKHNLNKKTQVTPKEEAKGVYMITCNEGEDVCNKKYSECIGQQVFEFLNSKAPVSYTHLDVYKRQVLNCLNSIFEWQEFRYFKNKLISSAVPLIMTMESSTNRP